MYYSSPSERFGRNYVRRFYVRQLNTVLFGDSGRFVDSIRRKDDCERLLEVFGNDLCRYYAHRSRILFVENPSNNWIMSKGRVLGRYDQLNRIFDRIPSNVFNIVYD
uniref:Uncharacterized protein n=1 Tax=Schizaphis graminum TaxID=13262 RepID=A0A2S2PDX1_SCHGA